MQKLNKPFGAFFLRSILTSSSRWVIVSSSTTER
nr:MAG TPA: hypothetical protein [Caudoviricetes sp.]